MERISKLNTRSEASNSFSVYGYVCYKVMVSEISMEALQFSGMVCFKNSPNYSVVRSFVCDGGNADVRK